LMGQQSPQKGESAPGGHGLSEAFIVCGAICLTTPASHTARQFFPILSVLHNVF
jgi:hypothetical protein